MNVCPKGHESSEPDYCSECGAKIGAEAAVLLHPATLPERCPDCGTAREQGGSAFCEICGYNFTTGVRGEVPVGPPVAAPIVAAPEAPDAVPAGWSLVIAVDPTLRQAGSPEAPLDQGENTVTLYAPVSLIGRRSEARAIFPEIALSHDDAVSHRHALLQLGADGGLTLRDIGAANGTQLNGREIAIMVDTPLKDGDVITLGHWSRLTVKAGAAS